jgi:hypothetical protein
MSSNTKQSEERKLMHPKSWQDIQIKIFDALTDLRIQRQWVYKYVDKINLRQIKVYLCSKNGKIFYMSARQQKIYLNVPLLKQILNFIEVSYYLHISNKYINKLYPTQKKYIGDNITWKFAQPLNLSNLYVGDLFAYIVYFIDKGKIELSDIKPFWFKQYFLESQYGVQYYSNISDIAKYNLQFGKRFFSNLTKKIILSEVLEIKN